MSKQELITELIHDNIADTYQLIDCLYINCNVCEKNRLLNQVRRNMSRLCRLLRQLQEDSLKPLVAAAAPVYTMPPSSAAPVHTMSASAPVAATPVQTVPMSFPLANTNAFLQPERSFTPAELARNNGKNGNPAYVAVNGTVYDVTNNATWAAASHFGVSAGSDVTEAFFSCHAGQPVLSKLKVVGKMTT